MKTFSDMKIFKRLKTSLRIRGKKGPLNAIICVIFESDDDK